MSRVYTYRTRNPKPSAEVLAERARARRLAIPQENPEAKRRYRQNHPDRVRAAKRDHYKRNRSRETTKRYEKQYGLSPEAYAARLTAQSGLCAICQDAPKPGRMLCLDHDHQTGQVRGLLCDRCNRGIGQFNDNPDRLRAAIRYLCPMAAVITEIA